ncbi:MAG TPA: DNA alkylation repair protein [Cytophagaceae bacterium]|jgi:3-methyladenine DNA glycosylase AlkD|nr:DNA alkylation repair protein [Cytophagaceae bacterium]
MTNRHQELLTLIKQHSGKGTQHTELDAYLGTSHFRYPINMPTLRKLLKTWASEHKEIKPAELATLISSLLEGESSTEKVTGGLLLDYFPAQRKQLKPALYDEWLNHVEGWSEIDALCQGHFTPEEMLEHWNEWKKTITQLSKSKNIEKRRGAMVLLVTPALQSGDEKFSTLALELFERTKHEKDILITKAISWLARCMVKHQRKALEEYLAEHKDSLPKIAVRELMVKLETGKKTKKKL